MKKILFKFKRIFTDNKEYFIKCTIMSVIAAFILGLAISLVVPSSAAEDPTESDQVIIPAGAYRFNGFLTQPDYTGFVPLYFTGSILYNGNLVDYTCTGIYLIYFGDVGVQLDFRDLIIDGVNVGNVTVYMNGQWLYGNDSTINITNDSSVDSRFASWFYSNTQPFSSYIIQAGHYYANQSIDSSYFDASDDSIKLRYYDPFSSTYVDTEGMIFTIENRDMYIIYYGADEVFLDGWHMDAYQSIEILNDATVDSNFYNCFFGLYSLSDADSNSYNVGFADGYIEGRDDGYAEGYNQGYHQGLMDNIGSSETFLGGVVENVLDALDKLVIVGNVSILDILKTVIGAFVVIFFLKLIAGG